MQIPVHYIGSDVKVAQIQLYIPMNSELPETRDFSSSNDNRKQLFDNIVRSGCILGSKKKYKLVSQLFPNSRTSAKGRSIVWEASILNAADAITEERVAIKFIKPDLDQVVKCSGAYENEVGIIRRAYNCMISIRHPHICPATDLFDVEELSACIVMPLIYGESLKEILERLQMRGGKLSMQYVQDILTPVADALDYMHKNNVIHRDVKPENIMLELAFCRSQIFNVQLIDYGVARDLPKAKSSEKCSAMTSVGTMLNMSPEQRNSGMQDSRSDQFSLATVAFEMLYGESPLKRNTEQAGVKFSDDDPVDHPFFTNGAYPKHITESLQKALSAKPEKRFASCKEFLDSLFSAKIHLGENDEATPLKLTWLRLFWIGLCAIVVSTHVGSLMGALPFVIISDSDLSSKSNWSATGAFVGMAFGVLLLFLLFLRWLKNSTFRITTSQCTMRFLFGFLGAFLSGATVLWNAISIDSGGYGSPEPFIFSVLFMVVGWVMYRCYFTYIPCIFAKKKS